MKIYCISGLGADKRVFNFLEVEAELIHIEWSPSYQWESLHDYAKKLCEQIDTSEPFVILGVSFGGMLATEMNKFVTPAKTILMSSLARGSEFPFWIQIGRKIRLHRYLPDYFFAMKAFFLIWFFNIRSERGKKTMLAITGDTDKFFNKLSLDKILTWNNESLPQNLVRIHGTADKLLPAPKGQVDYHVKGAGHFAIVENAEEVSGYINEILKDIS